MSEEWKQNYRCLFFKGDCQRALDTNAELSTQRLLKQPPERLIPLATTNTKMSLKISLKDCLCKP